MKVLILSVLSMLAIAPMARAEFVFVNTATVDVVRGATYEPPGFITIPALIVKEADGQKFYMTCESGPTTPYAVDGRIHVGGADFYTKRVATSQAECIKILQHIQKMVNANAKSTMFFDRQNGDINIAPRP